MNRQRSLMVLFPLALAAVAISVVFVGGASGAGKSSKDDDERVCNLASVKGTYAYNITGSVHSPAGAEVADVAAVGVITADGKGNATGHDWSSLNGVTTPRTVTATYTVAADCTGTAHAVFTPGGPVDIFFATADHNRVIKVIQTTPGGVVSGDEIRQ
jgi:hypothetical protein